MRALITGSLGFTGTHLVKSLEDDGHQVSRFDLRTGGDVRDYGHVRDAVQAADPDWIFHLAAVTLGEDARRTLDVNITGTLNVLEAVRLTGSTARVLLAGTSQEYGYEGRKPGERLTEDSACRPETAYGVSKLAAATLGMTYAHRFGLPVIATRAFNYTGWGKRAVSAESAFAWRIAAAERGEMAHVAHGDLSPVRNYTSVRDVIDAYRLAITLEPGIYNVCSPHTVTLGTVMGILTGLSTLPHVPLKEDPALGAPCCGTFPEPSCDRLRAAGWEPRVPLETALAEVLDYWRSRPR